jgi:2-polyprenyl-6-methoxyphenol hydroxylase-like FAD-dependent oxidoreductase
MSDQSTSCVIVGDGPAGMVAGLLLARRGVQVTLLEKHADFLWDFRGDTVHPSTLQLLDELGLYDQFTALPTVTKFEKLGFNANARPVVMTDFTRLRRLPHRYLALVPQWDLLNMLADAARNEPTFSLRMRHEVTGLLRDSNGRVTGQSHRTLGLSFALLIWKSRAACTLGGRRNAPSRCSSLPWSSTVSSHGVEPLRQVLK